jgi:hypothetical protein
MDVPDPLHGDIVSLFHPLKENWQEHFSISVTGECRGLTAKGRATVAALRMNDRLPRIAREIQIHLGLLSISSA